MTTITILYIIGVILGFLLGYIVRCLIARFQTPSADVVPREEFERLQLELNAISELSEDTREAGVIEELELRLKIDELTEEKDNIVRGIFAEIDKLAYRYLNDADYSGGDMIYDLAELKKKYIGDKQRTEDIEFLYSKSKEIFGYEKGR